MWEPAALPVATTGRGQRRLELQTQGIPPLGGQLRLEAVDVIACVPPVQVTLDPPEGAEPEPDEWCEWRGWVWTDQDLDITVTYGADAAFLRVRLITAAAAWSLLAVILLIALARRKVIARHARHVRWLVWAAAVPAAWSALYIARPRTRRPPPRPGIKSWTPSPN